MNNAQPVVIAYNDEDVVKFRVVTSCIECVYNELDRCVGGALCRITEEYNHDNPAIPLASCPFPTVETLVRDHIVAD